MPPPMAKVCIPRSGLTMHVGQVQSRPSILTKGKLGDGLVCYKSKGTAYRYQLYTYPSIN